MERIAVVGLGYAGLPLAICTIPCLPGHARLRRRSAQRDLNIAFMNDLALLELTGGLI